MAKEIFKLLHIMVQLMKGKRKKLRKILNLLILVNSRTGSALFASINKNGNFIR